MDAVASCMLVPILVPYSLIALFHLIWILTYFQRIITTGDRYPLKSFGPGRLLATFLCLLLPSLRPLMFESVSPLIVSLSLVDMLFLVFLLVFSMVLALHVVQF